MKTQKCSTLIIDANFSPLNLLTIEPPDDRKNVCKLRLPFYVERKYKKDFRIMLFCYLYLSSNYFLGHTVSVYNFKFTQ